MTSRTATPRLPMLHRLWRLLPAARRRSFLARAAALLAPRPARAVLAPQGGIIVVGELSRPSGLGEAARQMRAAFDAMGDPNWGIDLGDRLTPADPTSADAAPRGAPLLVHVNGPTLPLALARLPRRLTSGRRIIAYWAWELPIVPDTWRPALRLVHEIWVLSSFTADAIATILPPGSAIPLRAVPIPVAISPPRPSTRDRASFGLPADAVIVLTSFSLASSFARKNPLAAIAAFRAAFGPRPDRLLLLKIGNPAHYRDDLATITAATAGAANIRLLTETLTAPDAHALTACADIVLSLHRSEGFGLVPAEAMLLGVPVIATGWSGNMDFMDADSVALVPYTLVPASDPRGVFEAPGAVWAEPDIEAAAAHLARLAGDAPARRALGERGQRHARSSLGLAPVQAAIAAIGLKVAA